MQLSLNIFAWAKDKAAERRMGIEQRRSEDDIRWARLCEEGRIERQFVDNLEKGKPLRAMYSDAIKRRSIKLDQPTQ